MKPHQVALILATALFSAFFKGKAESFQIISQSDSSVTFCFITPRYIIDQADSVSIITTDDCLFIEQCGRPRLPRYCYNIQIPDEALYYAQTTSSNPRIIHNNKIITSKGNKKHNKTECVDTHQTKNLFPSNLVDYSRTYTYGHTKGLAISIHPFIYNEITHELLIHDTITVIIQFSKGWGDENISNDIFYANHNSKYVKSTKEQYTPERMLVVCPGNLHEAIKPLITWKNQKGIITTTFITDSISNANDIKQLVIDHFHKHQTSYLLLVGNSTQIPQLHYYGPSDNAYGFIDGDDAYPEVMVGRMPGYSPRDISSQVRKTIEYEQGLYFGDWLSKYILVASDKNMGDDGEYDYQHIQKIRDSLLHIGFTEGDELYDGSHGGQDADGNPTAQMLLHSINKGRGIFLYAGHSDEKKLYTSGFGANEVALLKNNSMTPIAIMAGCKVGALSSDTSLAELLLRAQNQQGPTGMVAMLASTIDQWWNPPLAAQDEIIKQLSDTNANHQLGAIVGKSFAYINSAYNSIGEETSSTWSIFGDPSLQLFTHIPRKNSLQFNKKITIGQDSIEVGLTQIPSIVTISTNNIILASKQCFETPCLITFPPIIDSGTMVIVTSSNNVKPCIDSAMISPSDNAFLIAKNIKIINRDTSKKMIIEAGDTLTFSFNLTNVGNLAAKNTIVDIKSLDSYFSVPTEHQIAKLIPPHTSSDSHFFFTIVLNPNIKDNSIIPITIQTKYEDGRTKTQSHSITVYSHDIELTRLEIAHTNYSNKNNCADPGEILNIGFILKNNGHSDVFINKTRITSDSPLVQFITSSREIKIPAQSTDTLWAVLLVSEKTNPGAMLPLHISLNIKHEEISMKTSLKIGNIVEDWESNTNAFDWHTNPFNSWITDSMEHFSGNFSITNKKIAHSDSAKLTLTINTLEYDTLRFRCKTSCETPGRFGDKTQYYDYFAFSMDGYIRYKQGGETEWVEFKICVPPGTHFFSFLYIKDEDISEYEDKVWIDFIEFPYFKQKNNPLIYFTSIPDSTSTERTTYSYLVSTNPANAHITSYMCPDWLSFDTVSKTLSGIAPDSGAYTVILSAKHENNYANQKFSIYIYPDKTNTPMYNSPRIYPNPSKNTITIRCETFFSYKIYNNERRLCKQGVTYNESIDLQGLIPGLYYIILFNEKEIIWEKFMKIE